ncbi:hypothetical protein ACFX13_001448 [Malus domestica]
MFSRKDMLDMVTTELDQAIHEERGLHNLLLKSLLPKDQAIHEERGTGGDEASLFAMDIFKMYDRFSHKKG